MRRVIAPDNGDVGKRLKPPPFHGGHHGFESHRRYYELQNASRAGLSVANGRLRYLQLINLGVPHGQTYLQAHRLVGWTTRDRAGSASLTTRGRGVRGGAVVAQLGERFRAEEVGGSNPPR